MTTLASSTPEVAENHAAPSAARPRALLAALLGLVCVGAGGLTLRWSLNASVALPLIGIVVFVAMASAMLLAMRDHPFARFGPANRVTLLRAVLVSLVAGLLTEPAARVAWSAIILTIIIAALDGVDGWLARRSGMRSAFGARFDMETDAFFMLVLSLLVWRHGRAGVWVLGIGLMRYAFVAAGWLWPWLAGPLTPTWRGKAIAIVQLFALGLAIVPQVPRSSSVAVCAIALAVLGWSFFVDIRRLHRAR